MWTPHVTRALSPLALFHLLSMTRCTPLPDFTVVQCSSTNVSFAIEWTEPPFQRSDLNFDTICKSLDGSYTTGCLDAVNSDYASVKVDSKQNVYCNNVTLMLLLQNMTTGYCASRIWIESGRVGIREPLNETTIKCSMPRPTPSASQGTTADELPPTNSVPNDKLNDYIPVLITLPVLLIFLISVVIVTVVVTVKIKCKQSAGVTIHGFTNEDKDFQASKFFNDIDPDERTVYDVDVQNNLEGISVSSFNSSYNVQFTKHLDREGSEQHQQQTGCQLEIDSKVHTKYIIAGGNYATLHMTSLMVSLAQSTADSNVDSCYEYQENCSAAMGGKMSLVDQKVPLNKKNDSEISTPESLPDYSACNISRTGYISREWGQSQHS